MPYKWVEEAGEQRLRAWPFRSLPRVGFVWFIAATSALFLLPLLALLGTSVLWGILPFMALAIGGIWFALERSYRAGTTVEELSLTRDRIRITRWDPGQTKAREWEANPYWVRARLRAGPVDNYLTLTDGGREIELGAFLTPEERHSLHNDLVTRLSAVR